MQRAVALRSGMPVLPRAIIRSNAAKRELQACRQAKVGAPIEMRLKEFGDGSGLD